MLGRIEERVKEEQELCYQPMDYFLCWLSAAWSKLRSKAEAILIPPAGAYGYLGVVSGGFGGAFGRAQSTFGSDLMTWHLGAKRAPKTGGEPKPANGVPGAIASP